MIEFKMNKAAAAVIGLLLLSAALWLWMAQSDDAKAAKRIEVYTDKQPVPFTVQPLLKDGTTLVQLRPLFESLGIEIAWNAATETVSGKKDGKTFSLKLKSKTAKVNGNTVTLASPAIKVGGHTMVPLRFVGEATGAVVGWNGTQGVISLYSEDFMKLAGLTKSAAQAIVNKGVPTVPKGTLQGFYAKWELDVGGIRMCTSLCWSYYYFLNDKQVVKTIPVEGPDAINCSKDKCLTYQIKDNQLILSNGEKHSIKIVSDKNLEIAGKTYTKYSPSGRLKLEGKYASDSYVTNPQGGIASSVEYTFFKDGTFRDDKFAGVTADGSDSDSETGTSVAAGSQSKSSGTYTIVHYTLLLAHHNGKVERKLFFLPEEPGVGMLRIGSRDYLLDNKPGGPGTPAKEPPYEDLLIKNKIAKKEVLFTFQPKKSEGLNGITVELTGYQWAKLNIEPAYASSFQGYGDKGIIALTAKYKIKNDSGQTVKANSIVVTLELDNPSVGLKSSPNLEPKASDELKSGASVEKMAVILLPADYFENNKDFQLSFGPMTDSGGKDSFQGDWLGFTIWKSFV
ncbi:copper amine oxidase N-terminal domain-containing protein [Paenibacillus sp. GCM10027627]|uniref:copper amine oxidase N-terminal domain-containing protein n=1 Tax=unclassified Paenibacillus TaxID=185978 RepID=UPI003637F740